MLRAAFVWIALQSLSLASPALHLNGDRHPLLAQTFPPKTTQVDNWARDRLSVALVFDNAVLPATRGQIRRASQELSNIEFQPEADTESLLRGLKCSEQWVSCQILAGQKLGVEKLLLLRFLNDDALHLQVIDIRLEISRGEIVIPWLRTEGTQSQILKDAQRDRIRNAFLVLLRDKPVTGELSLQDTRGGRVRVDGLVMPQLIGPETKRVYTLCAGSHYIEVENEAGEWTSMWMDIPGEKRVDLRLFSDDVSPEKPRLEGNFSSLFPSLLVGAGAVTAIGSMGFLGVSGYISQQTVPADTSANEVKNRLLLLEHGQIGAWVLGGLGIAMSAAGVLWEIFQNLDSEAEIAQPLESPQKP